MARFSLMIALLVPATTFEQRQLHGGQQKAQHEPNPDLFDQAYMRMMRDSTLVRDSEKHMNCDPITLKDCLERETEYSREVRGFSLKQLKNATEYLRKREREAVQTGP